MHALGTTSTGITIAGNKQVNNRATECMLHTNHW